MSAKVPLASRQHALNLYRQLLSLSKRLPSGRQRDDAVRSVRESFRDNAGVTDPSKASMETVSYADARREHAKRPLAHLFWIGASSLTVSRAAFLRA